LKALDTTPLWLIQRKAKCLNELRRLRSSVKEVEEAYRQSTDPEAKADFAKYLERFPALIAEAEGDMAQAVEALKPYGYEVTDTW
jgi:hypothetical protein